MSAVACVCACGGSLEPDARDCGGGGSLEPDARDFAFAFAFAFALGTSFEDDVDEVFMLIGN